LEQEVVERKRAESARAEMLARAQAARAEAEEANRLKDEFLAIVSHELRSPLNAMLGWVTLAREGRLDKASKERALETVERNARMQKTLIDDLLDVSAIITGNLSLDRKPTDLASVIETAVESIRRWLRPKRCLCNGTHPHTGPVAARPQQVSASDPELVHNAVKFTPREAW